VGSILNTPKAVNCGKTSKFEAHIQKKLLVVEADPVHFTGAIVAFTADFSPTGMKHAAEFVEALLAVLIHLEGIVESKNQLLFKDGKPGFSDSQLLAHLLCRTGSGDTVLVIAVYSWRNQARLIGEEFQAISFDICLETVFDGTGKIGRIYVGF
jgi:hypothetical protein